MSNLLLTFDTSTAVTAVGLCSGEGKSLWTNVQPSSHRHGEELLRRIQEGLQTLGAQPEDVEGLVVGIGPGSFTGLRIGISTAQGWSLALGTPALGVLSPLGVAAPLLERGASTVAVLGDAFKGEVALSLWAHDGQGHPHPWLAPRSCTPQAAATLMNAQALDAPITVAGDGFRRYAQVLSDTLSTPFVIAPVECDTPTPAALVAHALRMRKGGDPWNSLALAPHYVRDADAQLPAQPLKI